MKIEDIRTIGNLGTGTMGFATALAFAKAGYDVRMFGRSQASVERGFGSIKSALATFSESGLAREAEIPLILGRIKGVTTLEEAAGGADFIIESIAEVLEIKQEIYAKIDKICPPHTIFATDTSGLSPTAIAEAVERKDRFVVAHFWNPAHLLPLVEVVPGEKTSRETVELTVKLMEAIGKRPISMKREAPGFIGNRLQYALLREAMHIVEAGIASKEAVDAAVKYGIGRRLGVTGPLESADLGGLDVFYNISRYMMPELADTHEVSRILKDPVDRGEFGAKTGNGIYSWTPEGLSGIRKLREKILVEWLRKDKETVS